MGLLPENMLRNLKSERVRPRAGRHSSTAANHFCNSAGILRRGQRQPAIQLLLPLAPLHDGGFFLFARWSDSLWIGVDEYPSPRGKEMRYVAFGKLNDKLYLVTLSYRGHRRRLISAREATVEERERYEAQKKAAAQKGRS